MRPRLLKLRFLLFPAGSRRERWYHALRLGLLTWRQAGLRSRLAWPRMPGKAAGDSSIDSTLRYERWIRENEPGKDELARQRRQASELPYRPLISILTPVYNPSPDVLAETIHSVLSQTYDHWELCLVDGGSDRAGVKDILDRFSRQDTRLHLLALPENRGIAANSNAALEIAKGEYVALLDHDDLLAPNMLFEVAQHLNQAPETDIIYYDEDKISADGRRRSFPWFKPQTWSPDLLLSTNYLMHSVIRRSLIEECGGFDPKRDGAQDWDLALRLSADRPRLAHLPRVFYHWRQVPGSAASDASAKPWAFDAQLGCIRAHLDRQGISGAQVEFRGVGNIHIHWPISGRLASIIIPTRDKVDLLKACLASIFEKTTEPNFEILIMDTGSQERATFAYYEELKSEPRVRVLSAPGPFNYHLVNNLGARQARGEVLVFLNNDTQALDPGWLEELVGWAERPEVGVVGAKLLRPDGTIQHGGIIIGLAGHGSHLFDGASENTYGAYGSTEWYRDLHAVTGACLAIRREVFEQVGGFDEIYRVGYGDIDLCMRVEAAGYRVVYNPFARLLHHEGGTRGFSLPAGDVLRASACMGPKIRAGDPFFNPNLSNVKRIPDLPERGEPTREAMQLKIMADFDLAWPGDPGFADSKRWLRAEHRIEMADSLDSGKRFLFISHELSRTGAPLILLEVAKALKRDGYDILTLSPFEGPLRSSYEEAGIAVKVIPWLMEDARLFLEDLPGRNLVVANTIVAYRAIHAARAFGKPSLWFIYESGFGQRMAQSNQAVAQALSQAGAVIFPAQAIAALYQAYFQGNQHTIFTGMDVERPDPQTCADGAQVKPGTFKIISLASIESRKGQDLLLQAITALPAEIRREVECSLVGRILWKSEKRYCQRIQRMARQLGNVSLTGDVPHRQALCILDKSDVFILPSRDDALPISIIEAMALGKPVIAARVGGIGEIVHDNENGLLVDSGDFGGIAKHIEMLYHDRALGFVLGQQAQEFYQQNLTFAVFYQRLVTIMHELQFSPHLTDNRKSQW